MASFVTYFGQFFPVLLLFGFVCLWTVNKNPAVTGLEKLLAPNFTK